MSSEEEIQLIEVEDVSAVTDEDEEIICDDGNAMQVDGRPIPVNSKALWAKMTPEEHHRRLMMLDEDIEAWQHLGDLIWVRVAHDPRIYRILRRGGVSLEDQVRSIMGHILRRIEQGSLPLREPCKFYGWLKTVIIRCLQDVLRKNWVEDDATFLDETTLAHSSTKEDSLDSLERKQLRKTIWQAVLVDAPIKNPKHRRALELSLQMKMGAIAIKNNDEIAQRLELELGETVTTKEAGQWIHAGKQVLVKYLEEKGLGPKKKNTISV